MSSGAIFWMPSGWTIYAEYLLAICFMVLSYSDAIKSLLETGKARSDAGTAFLMKVGGIYRFDVAKPAFTP